MLKKIFILVISVLFYTNNSLAMVSFKVQGADFIGTLKLEDNLMLITDKKDDFIILYNKKNEVIYYKHKNMISTYKVSLLKIEEKSKQNQTSMFNKNTSLNLLGYNAKLSELNINKKRCLGIYGSKDLGDSFSSSLSSMYALYKGFVYMTGVAEIKNSCKDVSITEFTNKKVGFPLTVFYANKELTLLDLKNEKKSIKDYLLEHKLNMKKAYSPTLDAQYELIFSLLTEQQQKIFLKTSKNKTLEIKIRAISNLLHGF